MPFDLPTFGFGATNPDQDVQAQAAALARKQKILDAMQQAQMQQPLVGNQGGIQAIAKLIGMMAGQGRSNTLENEASANRDRYGKELGVAANSYLDQRQGKPAMPGTGPAMPDSAMGDFAPSNSGGSPAVPANPRGAIISAMTSKFPELQKIGAADFGAFGKSEAPKFEKVGDSLYKVFSDGRPPERVVQNEKPIVVNGQLVKAPGSDAPSVVGDYRDKYGKLVPVGTDPETGKPIQAQVQVGTGENKYPPKGVNVKTEVQLGENAFAKAFGSVRAKAIEESHTKAQSASQALAALDAAQEDFDAGVKSGLTAPVGLALAKFGKSLGLEGDASIANTESYRANMARETLNLIKGLGSGTAISNSDREFAENASGGKITLDDQTMVRLMNVAKAAAANVVQGHNEVINKNKAASPELAEGLDTMVIPFAFKGGGGVEWNATERRYVPIGAATSKLKPKTPTVTNW